jgi:hypothetical protein
VNVNVSRTSRGELQKVAADKIKINKYNEQYVLSGGLEVSAGD